MRILGLDFGSKTVGVAVSDGLLLTAQGVETIERKDENKLRKTCARIEELIAEYEVTEIVLGLPKNMNNTIGDRAEKSLEFAEMLKRRQKAFYQDNAQTAGFCQWMTTVDEFNAITQQMYDRGYVMVSINDLVKKTVDDDGTVHYEEGDIYLPEGKKAFVLSLDDL